MRMEPTRQVMTAPMDALANALAVLDDQRWVWTQVPGLGIRRWLVS